MILTESKRNFDSLRTLQSATCDALLPSPFPTEIQSLVRDLIIIFLQYNH